MTRKWLSLALFCVFCLAVGFVGAQSNPSGQSPIAHGISAGGGGGVSGLSTCDGGTAIADNAILRGDGTTGCQGSAITVADTTGTMTFTSTGLVLVGDGAKTGPGLSFANDPNSGFYERTGDRITVSLGGTAEYEFQTTGFAVGGLNMVGWTNGDVDGAGIDAGLYRSAAGVVKTVTTSSSTIGSFLTKVLVEANTAGSGAPNVLTATESGTVLTNEGATAANYHTLPTAAAGYQFEFCVQDSDGMRIVASSGDTIRVIDKVTSAGGYIESTSIGSCVRGVALNDTEWFSTSTHGVWTDGTFTYDDTGLTSP